MIVKQKGKWCVVSEKTGRSFGCYGTKKEAEHRLKQVEFFKHLKSIPKSKIRKPSVQKRANARQA
jgi:hypothetical protein